MQNLTRDVCTKNCRFLYIGIFVSLSILLYSYSSNPYWYTVYKIAYDWIIYNDENYAKLVQAYDL